MYYLQLYLYCIIKIKKILNLLADGRIVTTVRHQNEGDSTVDGFQEPGSFKQDFIYDANIFQIEALINRSHSCWQPINYACKQSRLFNSPGNILTRHFSIFKY